MELWYKYPDVIFILMDIQMPGMDRYEASRQIRKFNKEVVIIAQNAYALSGDIENAMKAGFDEYISKPLKKVEMAGLLQKYFKA